MLRALIIIAALASAASAQDSFLYRCPKGDAVLPASCLEAMRVHDAKRDLSSQERHQLAYLFAKSYLVSIVKYRQDYAVNPAAPICRLLVANFHEAGKLATEGGIWLGSTFDFFRAQPAYRKDVERALRELPVKQRRQFAR